MALQEEGAEDEAPGERDRGGQDHQPVQRDPQAGGERQGPGGQAQQARQQQGVGQEVEDVGGRGRGRFGPVRSAGSRSGRPARPRSRRCPGRRAGRAGGGLPGAPAAGSRRGPPGCRPRSGARSPRPGRPRPATGRCQDPGRQQPVDEQCQRQPLPHRDVRGIGTPGKAGTPAGCACRSFQVSCFAPASGGRFLARERLVLTRISPLKYGTFAWEFSLQRGTAEKEPGGDRGTGGRANTREKGRTQGSPPGRRPGPERFQAGVIPFSERAVLGAGG